MEEKKAKNEKQAVNVVICNVLAAEMDKMWSFYHDKSHQIWLWWAVDHATNTPLAYVFGTREHKYLEELLKLPEPFSIGTVYADNNFAYNSKNQDNQLVTGKKNTQRIERDHLTLRTRTKRLARKTVCFSRDKEIHMAVVGTFINLFFFHRPFDDSIFSEGKSLENALYMAQDALRQWLECTIEVGQEIPAASRVEYIAHGRGEFFNLIRTEVKDDRAVRRTVSIPKWMYDAATGANLSLSRVLQDALRERLDVR